jgi:hypothetical protein
MDKPQFVPTVETGEELKTWCENGIDEDNETLLKQIELVKNCETEDILIKLWSDNQNLTKNESFKTAWIDKRQKFYDISKKILDACSSLENLESMFLTLPESHQKALLNYKNELIAKIK